MPKKSRKVGRIGIPKSDRPRQDQSDRANETSQGRVNRKSGNKSGTRQQLKHANQAANKNDKQDDRVGSKKPIDLNKYKAGGKVAVPKEKKVVVYKTPQAEIEAIENNQELEVLLEKQIDGKLTASEQSYVDTLTTRYRELCDLVGIEVDEYIDDDESLQQEIDDQDDPFSKLDAIKIDDYKD